MSILTGIVAHHQTLTGLTALVSNRAYPMGKSPQSPTYPYYTFQRISTPSRAGSHSGDSQLEEVRIQMTVRAKTAIEVDGIVTQLKTGFLGFRGTMGDVYVSGVRLGNDIDDFDPATSTYGRFVDFLMWARPTL